MIQNLMKRAKKRAKICIYLASFVFLSITVHFLYVNTTQYKFFYKKQNLTIVFNTKFYNEQNKNPSDRSCVYDISNKTGNLCFLAVSRSFSNEIIR